MATRADPRARADSIRWKIKPLVHSDPSKPERTKEACCPLVRYLAHVDGCSSPLAWFSSATESVRCSLPHPEFESLYIKWSAIKKLDAIEKGVSLRYLHIGSSTGVESIEPLRSLTSLKWLGLESVTRVDSLDPLCDLVNLYGLTVEGSLWTKQVVETLAPVGNLHHLRYLSIINLQSRDRTLSPLFALTQLEVFHAASWWSQSEVAELFRRNPKLTE